MNKDGTQIAVTKSIKEECKQFLSQIFYGGTVLEKHWLELFFKYAESQGDEKKLREIYKSITNQK